LHEHFYEWGRSPGSYFQEFTAELVNLKIPSINKIMTLPVAMQTKMNACINDKDWLAQGLQNSVRRIF
jgi:hypothetical protein